MVDLPSSRRLRDGIASATAGNRQAAREHFRAATRADSANEDAWLWLAFVADSPAEALEHFERALTVNPSSAVARKGAVAARFQLGIALAGAGHVTEACQQFRAIVAADGDHAPAWHWLSGLVASPLEATACLRRVVALAPGNHQAREDLVQLEADLALGEQPRSSHPPETAGRRILVVDDSLTVRKLVAVTLQRAGYQVVLAAGSFEAADWLRQVIPELILLDVVMPGIDGYSLCQRIRSQAETAHVPIVLISGKDGFFERIRGKLAGATATLLKPFRAEQLLDVVTQHAGQRYSPEPTRVE